MKKELLCAAMSVSFIVLTSPSAAPGQGASFQGLGFIGGGGPRPNTLASAISGNGSVVVGSSINASNQGEPFRWTLATGISGLGFIDGGGLSPIGAAQAVSADGSTVIGYSTNASNRYEAFRWTAATGIRGLGFLGGGGSSPYSSSDFISADGAVVVGLSTNAGDNYEAFRWTSSGGMTGLGFIDGGGSTPYSATGALNPDGSVVAGMSTNAAGHYEAFRWTELTGMRGLGFIGGGGGMPYSSAVGISRDGSVIIGTSTNAADQYEAFRWTSATGMQGLGFIDGGGSVPLSGATGVSADGGVIVGMSSNAVDRQEVFRWTAGTGMRGLGFIDGGGSTPSGWATALNADGSVIVGFGSNADDRTEAFRWTERTGMQSVAQALSSAGVSIGSWFLAYAASVSADGSLIVGNGVDPDGITDGWIARIPLAVDPESPPAGFISPAEIRASVADTSMKVLHAQAGVLSALSDQRFAALEQCHAGHSGEQAGRFCAFITGNAAFWGNNGDFHDGERISGAAGIAMRIAPGVAAGVAFNAGKGRYDLRLGGLNEVSSYGASVFVSYAQSGREGLQLLAAGTASHFDLDVTRSYLNGMSAVSQSKGSAEGAGLGGLGRIGWGFRISGKTWLTPFAEIEWSHARTGGYLEKGGAFPIRFNRQFVNETDIRSGMSVRHDLTGTIEIFGDVAWVHRLSGRAGDLTGVMVDVFDVGPAAPRLRNDWAEITAGASWRITPRMRFSGAVSTMLGNDARPDALLRIGLAADF